MEIISINLKSCPALQIYWNKEDYYGFSISLRKISVILIVL